MKVNRRDFSKICASAVITGVVLDGSALPAKVGEPGAGNEESTDAYVRREGTAWIMGTEKVERRVGLQDGHFLLTSFRNKITGRELRDRGAHPDEIRMTTDGVSSTLWHWEFVSEHAEHLGQGELQLDIRLRGGPVEVTKHWVLYPGCAIIREWLTIENVSAKDVRLQDLFFFNTRVLGGGVDNPQGLENLELAYLTGGGNYNGSQLLKKEHLDPGYTRTFDSAAGIQTGYYSAYLPLLLLRDLHSSDSIAVGWDYLGHWKLQVGNETGDQVGVSLQVAGYDDRIPPGGQVITPKAFAAAFSGDLDAIGNQILDWQYRYLWEFTNPDYFGKTRWAVDWPDPWVGDGGTPSADNWGRRLSLDLRYADLLREAGGDILWDDAGWYDRWGDWTGPEWRLTTDYLSKYGMRWALWQPTYLATAESKVAQEHPDWLIPGSMVLDQSIAATTEWQKKLLDRDVAAWNDFQWRFDGWPASAANDTKMLAADREFRDLLQYFKTSHRKSGIDQCAGGGRLISYDIARFADSGEYTDGGVGPYSGYYTSLLVPPDKLHNVVDFDRTYYDPSSARTHLAMDPTWYRDPGDGEDVESIRKDWEIYHYLISQGVAGRWSHVFRPRVTGDDAIWYHQRMNADGSRGVIIAKHAKTGAGYFLISKPLANTSGDHYEGHANGILKVLTTDAVNLDTGIYQDPTDGEYRYYGNPGEVFGPLNFRYRTAHGEESYVTRIAQRGMDRPVDTHFFGMSFQAGSEPIEITELGQFHSGSLGTGAQGGTYSLMLVRAVDKAILASATLDLSQAHVDSLGFKYAKLDKPIRLEAGLDRPVVVFPGGLQAETMYDVQACHSKLHLKQTGAKLMAEGIALSAMPAGELIFLNLPHVPGSGTDQVAPEPPSHVTKRVGTNLGTQGIEIAWSEGRDDNWVSYYEVIKNGSTLGKCAKGTFFFDHSLGARHDIAARYEVRTVDGDGNRSSLVSAAEIPGEREIHQPLGEFWSAQGQDGWRYEQSFDEHKYEDMSWHSGGYEGYWSGSGLGRIGRIWAQPAAQAEIGRTFVFSQDSSATISGELQKDPSAESTFPVYVRIEKNQAQIWPAAGWAAVPAFGSPMDYEIKDLAVSRGDSIRFVVKRIEENRSEPIIWNPRITLAPRS